MKLTYYENDFGAGFDFEPETPKEVAQLLRVAKNSKAQKPAIYFSFSGDNPYLNLYLSKVSKPKQDNSLRPPKR